VLKATGTPGLGVADKPDLERRLVEFGAGSTERGSAMPRE
jgi:hypothetical protein